MIPRDISFWSDLRDRLDPLWRFFGQPHIKGACLLTGKLLAGFGCGIFLIGYLALHAGDSRWQGGAALLGMFILPVVLFILARRFDRRWKNHIQNRRNR